MSRHLDDYDTGTTDDWYFTGREPNEDQADGISDPTLWDGFPMREPVDLDADR